MKNNILFITLCLSLTLFGQFDETKYYRLTTKWQGEGLSLDVINDGINDKLHLAITGNYSGQKWKITDLKDGYFRLTTKWQGEEMSLDIINDGTNDKIHLAKTGNYSGQKWKITNLNDGYYRLTSKWQGDEMSLDVINDGTNNKLHLSKTGNYSGQKWKIVLSDAGNSSSKGIVNDNTCYCCSKKFSKGTGHFWYKEGSKWNIFKESQDLLKVGVGKYCCSVKCCNDCKHSKGW